MYYVAVLTSLFQAWPVKVMKHLCDTAGIIIVARNVSCFW